VDAEKHTTKTWTMNSDDLIAIYEEMKAVFARDKDLTHIEVIFKIQPVKTEKKLARITVTTFKDGH
jgi:hypothetical protein